MATKAEIEAAAMALACHTTEGQWDALMDHEAAGFRAAAVRALEAAEAIRAYVPWDSNANRQYEPVECRAQNIYDSFEYDGPGRKPAWTPNGNGLKQDEARALARKELREAGHKPTATRLMALHDSTIQMLRDA
jgi:hypothetical protein